MKVAINWSYIEAGTVVVDVPNNTDLGPLLACELPAQKLIGSGELQIDEVCQADGTGYENCLRGRICEKQMFGIPYGLTLKISK